MKFKKCSRKTDAKKQLLFLYESKKMEKERDAGEAAERCAFCKMVVDVTWTKI